MIITRENHAHYMGKLAPFLLAVYLLQTWFYSRLLSPTWAYDISVFLGIGLILIVAAFLAHDYCYVATLGEREIGFKLRPFPYERALAYREIDEVKVIPTRLPFAHIRLTTDEGRNIWLYNVDNAHQVARTIEERRYR